MFDNFIKRKIETSETEINLVIGGRGKSVLLLHGYPQTHVCWHLVAPKLAEHFTVVCADLRGCGDSAKPLSDDGHFAYSKRVMARDQVEAMQKLGFDDFSVVGHDRGARVAHRMALDHPERITKLALLDIIPTLEAFERTDQAIATAAYNWFMSIQPDGLPEKLIGADPQFFLNYCLNHWADKNFKFSSEAIAEYERCFDQEMIRATNEEFRAAAGVDLEHDRADLERKIACPLLLLWSTAGMWAKYDILEIWNRRAGDVSGAAFDCGHFLPEENPQKTASELIGFLL